MTYSEFRTTQKTFSSSEGKIRYIDEGKGDVILLLHGVPTSGWLYRHMIPQLAKNNRIIVPDMLGFGNSDSPEGYEIYSESQHAKRLIALMDSLKISHWTHVMHDAGGLWTWELLTLQPNRIASLVIFNSIIYEAGFKPPIRFDKGIIARLAMWSYRNRLTSKLMLKGLLKSGLMEFNLDKNAFEGYAMPLEEGKTKAMYYFFTQTCNALPNYKPLLKSLKIPSIVIWGAHDSFLLWKPQEEAVKSDLNIRDSHIHVLEAKHFIQEEQPEEISRLLQHFLGKINSPEMGI